MELHCMGLRSEDMMIFTVSFGSEALMDYLPSIVILGEVSQSWRSEIETDMIHVHTILRYTLIDNLPCLEIFLLPFFRQGRSSIKVYLKIVWTWISVSISLHQLWLRNVHTCFIWGTLCACVYSRFARINQILWTLVRPPIHVVTDLLAAMCKGLHEYAVCWMVSNSKVILMGAHVG